MQVIVVGTVRFDSENMVFVKEHYKYEVSAKDGVLLVVDKDGVIHERISLYDDEAKRIIAELASESGSISAYLFASSLYPDLLSWFFMDVRYVVRFTKEGIHLEAVELLPCIGSPECRWIRVEGDTFIEGMLLDSLEMVINHYCDKH